MTLRGATWGHRPWTRATRFVIFFRLRIVIFLFSWIGLRQRSRFSPQELTIVMFLHQYRIELCVSIDLCFFALAFHFVLFFFSFLSLLLIFLPLHDYITAAFLSTFYACQGVSRFNDRRGAQERIDGFYDSSQRRSWGKICELTWALRCGLWFCFSCHMSSCLSSPTCEERKDAATIWWSS